MNMPHIFRSNQKLSTQLADSLSRFLGENMVFKSLLSFETRGGWFKTLSSPSFGFNFGHLDTLNLDCTT